MKRKLNQFGYGAVEIILILVALGIVGGTGYYVISQNNKKVEITDSKIQKTKNKENQIAKSQNPDPLKEWKTYKSRHGFSVKYPPEWSVTSNEIDKYETIPPVSQASHFAISYIPSENKAQEGPAAFAGGNVKVETSVYQVNENLDEWVEKHRSQIEEEHGSNIKISDREVGKHPAKTVTFDGGVYGDGGYSVYVIIKGVGFIFHVYSEDPKNPPSQSLQLINSLEY